MMEPKSKRQECYEFVLELPEFKKWIEIEQIYYSSPFMEEDSKRETNFEEWHAKKNVEQLDKVRRILQSRGFQHSIAESALKKAINYYVDKFANHEGLESENYSNDELVIETKKARINQTGTKKPR